MKTRIKVSENFFVDEYVPKEIHDLIEKGDAKLSDYQDERIPVLMQWIRTNTGLSVTLNNWINGGPFDERGVRMPNTSTGASRSRHKFEKNLSGKIIRKSDGIDSQIGTMNGKQMFEWAEKNKIALFGLGVRCIEHYSFTPGWLHLDLHPRTKIKDEITIVTLKSIHSTWKIQ
jgi:hypothetical protein